MPDISGAFLLVNPVPAWIYAQNAILAMHCDKYGFKVLCSPGLISIGIAKDTRPITYRLCQMHWIALCLNWHGLKLGASVWSLHPSEQQRFIQERKECIRHIRVVIADVEFSPRTFKLEKIMTSKLSSASCTIEFSTIPLGLCGFHLQQARGRVSSQSAVQTWGWEGGSFLLSLPTH